jgi:hypothetical protein
MKMPRFIDAANSNAGELYVALDDGSIRARLPPSGAQFQHLPPSQRPGWVWTKIAAPAGVKARQVIPGPVGTLLIITTDGRMFERTRDPMFQGHIVEPFIWKEVELEDV